MCGSRKCPCLPPQPKVNGNSEGEEVEDWSLWGVWVHRKLLFHAREEEASKRQRTIDQKQEDVLTYNVLIKKLPSTKTRLTWPALLLVFHLSLLALLSLGLFKDILFDQVRSKWRHDRIEGLAAQLMKLLCQKMTLFTQCHRWLFKKFVKTT